MNQQTPIDPQDTPLNGLITGIATPIVFFFLWKGIGWILAEFFIDNWGGFSLKFLCMVAIVGNLIPFQLFNKYERGRAMQALLATTFILIAIVVLYFRNLIFQ